MYNTGHGLNYDISNIINDPPIKKQNNKINIIIIISFFINICILSVGAIFLINYNDVIKIKNDINNYVDLIDYIRDNSILNNETKTVHYIDKLESLIDKACVMIDC